MIRGYPRYKFAASSFVLICDGNSLTAGVGASGSSAYWPAVANSLSPTAGLGVTPTNVAVAGQGIATIDGGGPASSMTSRGAAQVDANLVSAKMNILAAWEFTNEVKYLAGDAATAHANMKAYCLARRAAAASAGKTLRIVVATAIPALYGSQTQGTINAWNAALQTANTLMRQQFRSYADVLCDIAGYAPFAGLFAAGDFTATPFDATGVYSGDRVHLNDAGYLLVGRAFARAFARVRP